MLSSSGAYKLKRGNERQHDLLAVAQVLFPRARVPVVSEVFLKPDLKVEGLHIVPSTIQKM